MAKLDNKFNYIFAGIDSTFDYRDKARNTLDSVCYMFDRSAIMFKYHGLPDSIPAEELERLLQVGGFAIFGKINGELYALSGGLGGEGDVYNRPTLATVAVPYLNYNGVWEIGKDCIIMKNDSSMLGLTPMYKKYCWMLTENEITMILLDINKRVQTLISAADDSTKESAEKYLQDVVAGKIGVIAESKLFESLKISPYATTSAATLKDLFEYHQYIKASLFNEIGLSANFNMKRERLTAGEVEANSDNLYPLVDNMLYNRREALQAVNSLFGTSIEVELNSSWDYRVFAGASIHNTEEEVEAPADAEEEAPADAGKDAEEDTPADAEEDTPADAEEEAPADAGKDAEEDTPADAEENNNG